MDQKNRKYFLRKRNKKINYADSNSDQSDEDYDPDYESTDSDLSPKMDKYEYATIT